MSSFSFAFPLISCSYLYSYSVSPNPPCSGQQHGLLSSILRRKGLAAHLIWTISKFCFFNAAKLCSTAFCFQDQKVETFIFYIALVHDPGSSLFHFYMVWQKSGSGTQDKLFKTKYSLSPSLTSAVCKWPRLLSHNTMFLEGDVSTITWLAWVPDFSKMFYNYRQQCTYFSKWLSLKLTVHASYWLSCSYSSLIDTPQGLTCLPLCPWHHSPLWVSFATLTDSHLFGIPSFLFLSFHDFVSL